MANTVTQNLSAEFISGVRFVKPHNGGSPITTADADIDGYSTVTDITNAENIAYTVANAQSETEYDTTETTEQVTARRPQNDTTVDVVSGQTVAAGDAKDSMTITSPLNHAQKKFFRDAVSNGERIIAIVIENDSSGNQIEDAILLGKVTGDFTNESARQKTFEITIQGGEAHSPATGGLLADYNTAVTASGIAREGKDDTSALVTPTTLTASEYADGVGVPTGELTFIDHA